MRILVTGGAGFIGSHVVERYLSAGHDVTVADNLVTGKKANLPGAARFVKTDVLGRKLPDIFAEGRFEVVCHLAAQVSVAHSVSHPLEDARTNILGLLTVLDLASHHGVRKVIFSSSGGTVYGDPPVLPATEGMPYAALSPYGVSKVAGELYLPLFQRYQGLTYTSLRYSNVYGPRQDPYGEAGVVAIFTNKMLRGETPTINGDGSHLRDYVFVKDVAEANVLALHHGDNAAVNIGTGVGTTNSQLYEAIRRETDFPHPANHGPERAGDLKKNVLDPSLAFKMLGWKATFSLPQGIAETVAYFQRKKGR